VYVRAAAARCVFLRWGVHSNAVPVDSMVLVESSVSQKGAICLGSHLVRFCHSFGMTGASLWQEIHFMAVVLFTLNLVYRLGLCFMSVCLSQMFLSILNCDMKSST